MVHTITKVFTLSILSHTVTRKFIHLEEKTEVIMIKRTLRNKTNFSFQRMKAISHHGQSTSEIWSIVVFFLFFFLLVTHKNQKCSRYKLMSDHKSYAGIIFRIPLEFVFTFSLKNYPVNF